MNPVTQDKKGEIVIYRTEDGKATLEVTLEEHTVWLAQAQMASLFGKDVRTMKCDPHSHMAEINWTSEVQQWLRDIHDYIAIENPKAALNTVETIFEKAQILKKFPEAGYDTSNDPIETSGFCSWAITESPI